MMNANDHFPQQPQPARPDSAPPMPIQPLAPAPIPNMPTVRLPALPVSGPAVQLRPEFDQSARRRRRIIALTAVFVFLLGTASGLGALFAAENGRNHTLTSKLDDTSHRLQDTQSSLKQAQDAASADGKQISDLQNQLSLTSDQLKQVTKDRDNLAADNAKLKACADAAKALDAQAEYVATGVTTASDPAGQIAARNQIQACG